MGQILITGATGFLGGCLVRRLYSEGHDVVATGRNRAKLNTLPLPEHQLLCLDLCAITPPHLADLLGDVEAIVHCAALSTPWGPDAAFRAANVTATEKLIDLGRILQIRHFVHVSTPAVYFRFEDQRNVPENLPLPKPVNNYARTKAIAEERVAESGLPFTIIRPRGIYGVGETALLPRLLRAAEAGPLPRFRNGVAETDITHVDDVVDALCCILRKLDLAQGKVFNISGGQPLRIHEIVEKVAARKAIAVSWRDLPVAPVLAAIRAGEWLARLRPGSPEPRITTYSLGIFAYTQTLDLTRAQNRLGWRPRITFEEGLARTFSHSDGSPLS